MRSAPVPHLSCFGDLVIGVPPGTGIDRIRTLVFDDDNGV